MMGSRKGSGPESQRWLAVPANEAQADLRKALDEAAARDADEVALRRVWARVADMPALMLPAPAADRILDAQQERDQLRAQLQSQIGSRDRSRRPWIVAASLAGATATLAFLLAETKSEMRGARVTTPAAQAVTVGVAAKREVVDQRSVLVAPATVRTGRGETLHLSLNGGTDVVVTSESTLVLDENDRPSVSAGEVQFRVPPQAPGRVFTVAAAAYRVVVVGTRFRVNVREVNAAVTVDEGVVEIWTDRRIARVAAGKSWASSGAESSPAVTAPIAPVAPVAPVVAPSSKASRGARVLRSSRRRVLALSGPSSGGVAVTQAATVPSSYSSPSFASAATAPAPSPAVSTSSTISAPGGAALPEATASPAIAPPPAAAAPVMVPVPVDAGTLATQARAARAAGDARRALGLYRALVQKGGAAGENAEYEIGRVLRDGLRQPREAVSAWRSYRAQHPRGLLRIEADLSVIETLASMGDKAGAAGEASDFIRRYPESERRMEIARLAGDLLRERGDCVGAIGAYDIAVAGGRARRDMARSVADGVSFHRSACLLRGDQTQGVAALRSYLQAFPTGRFRAEAQRLLTGAQSPAAAPSRP